MKNRIKFFEAEDLEKLEKKINSFFSYMEKEEGRLFQVQKIHYQIDGEAMYPSVLLYYSIGVVLK